MLILFKGKKILENGHTLEILSKGGKKKKEKVKKKEFPILWDLTKGNNAQSSHSSTIAAALTELNMCTTGLKQNLWEART